MKCRLTEKCLQAGCEQAQTALDQPTLVLGIRPCARAHTAQVTVRSSSVTSRDNRASPRLTIVGEEDVESTRWREQAGVINAKPAKLVEG